MSEDEAGEPMFGGASRQGAPLLLGCMTGASQEVALRISRAAVSARAKDFLLQVLVASFGSAGYQQRAGHLEPGLSCAFDLAEWAKRHDWDRHYLWRVRQKIVDLGILTYEADTSDPARGWLRWNLDFSQWQALDQNYRKQRYTRRGAGRPVQSNVIRLPDSGEVLPSDVIRSAASAYSNVIQQTVPVVFKRDTVASLDGATGAGSEGSVRRDTEKKTQKKNTDAIASGGARPPSSESTEGDEGSYSVPAIGNPSTVPLPKGWPERVTGENELKFYLRAVQQSKNVPAATAYVAHLVLGIIPDSPAIKRLGGIVVDLRRRFGQEHARWGLLVKAIYETGRAEYDSEPLSYVQEVAVGLIEREQRKGQGSKTLARTTAGQPKAYEPSVGLPFNHPSLDKWAGAD